MNNETIRAEIQNCFDNYIQIRGNNGKELLLRLADIIMLRQFDNLCYEYEKRIDLKGDTALYTDSEFSRILQKHTNRLLKLTGNKVPCDDALCDLLERSLIEMLKWQTR